MTSSTRSSFTATLVAILGGMEFLFATRILTGGTAGGPPPPGMEGASGPPFAAGILLMVIAVACFFAAYGIWKDQRWGRIVALIAASVSGLLSLGDLLGTVAGQQFVLASVAALELLLCVAIVILVLRGQRRLQAG